MYLIHHGIKGQKWGVRRYQNDDGTLTSEGQKRYYGHVEATNKGAYRYKDVAKSANMIRKDINSDFKREKLDLKNKKKTGEISKYEYKNAVNSLKDERQKQFKSMEKTHNKYLGKVNKGEAWVKNGGLAMAITSVASAGAGSTLKTLARSGICGEGSDYVAAAGSAMQLVSFYSLVNSGANAIGTASTINSARYKSSNNSNKSTTKNQTKNSANDNNSLKGQKLVDKINAEAKKRGEKHNPISSYKDVDDDDLLYLTAQEYGLENDPYFKR